MIGTRYEAVELPSSGDVAVPPTAVLDPVSRTSPILAVDVGESRVKTVGNKVIRERESRAGTQGESDPGDIPMPFPEDVKMKPPGK